MDNGVFTEAMKLDQEQEYEQNVRNPKMIAHYKAVVARYRASEATSEVPQTPTQQLLARVEESGAHFEVFLQAVPREIGQTEKKAFRKKLKDPFELAIKEGKPISLKSRLGPDLFLKRKKFVEQSQLSYWSWLQDLIDLSIIQLKEKILIEFIQEYYFPALVRDETLLEKMTPGQWSNPREGLKKRLYDEFNNVESFRIPATWYVTANLSATIKKYVAASFNRALTQIMEMNSIIVAETLFDLHEEAQKLMEKAISFEGNQKRLNASYHTAMAHDASELWHVFQTENGVDSELLAHLHTAHIAEIPIDEFGSVAPAGITLSFLDWAIEEYLKSVEAEKLERLQVIQLLVQHGGRLTYRPTVFLGFSLLKILLENVAVQTDFQHLVKQFFVAYLLLSMKQIESTWWHFFHSLRRKIKHVMMVQELVISLYLPQTGQSSLSWDQHFVAKLKAAAAENAASILDRGELSKFFQAMPKHAAKRLTAPWSELSLAPQEELLEVTTSAGERRPLLGLKKD